MPSLLCTTDIMPLWEVNFFLRGKQLTVGLLQEPYRMCCTANIFVISKIQLRLFEHQLQDTLSHTHLTFRFLVSNLSVHVH